MTGEEKSSLAQNVWQEERPRLSRSVVQRRSLWLTADQVHAERAGSSHGSQAANPGGFPTRSNSLPASLDLPCCGSDQAPPFGRTSMNSRWSSRRLRERRSFALSASVMRGAGSYLRGRHRACIRMLWSNGIRM